MASSDDGLLVTVFPFQPSVTSLDGGALCTGGRQSGLDEGRAQIAITTPRLSASTFASTLVLSRTDPCPAAELSRRLERRHVGTGFCDDDFGRPPLNTRNGGEPLQDRCKGHQQAVDLGGAIANGVLDDGDLVEDLRSQEGMVRSKSSLQSCSEGWQLRPKFATRQVGQQRRISGPFDQRSDDGTT